MSEDIKPSKVLCLSAIDPIFESNIPVYTEEKARGKEYVNYGQKNSWPNYLWDLYNNVATLQAIINGSVDFICGDKITLNVPNHSQIVNQKGETVEDIVKKIALDRMIFGGYALQIIRSLDGGIAEIYAWDFMKVRSDEKNEVFYYSDDWTKWGAKALVYPKYGINDSNPTSVYYNKGNITRSVYPTPVYNAALIACELEKAINEYHLNNINNGFATNLIINFNDGKPSKDDMEEMEKNVTEKFTGYQNAGRILLSFNDSAENATTIERLNSDDFDDKYSALSERTRNQIFTAFRANPCLFGLNPENDGFSQVEFESCFKLFNKTVIQPIQKEISSSFDKIYGVENSLIIDPFKIQWETNEVA